MGCIHHLIKLLPNLAEMSEPLRPLPSKANTKAQNKLDWNEKHTESFNEINYEFKILPKTNTSTLKNKQE